MAQILVVYFSRADENYYPHGIAAVAEGNTAKLAQRLAQLTGASLFEVKSDHHYPQDYHACTREAQTLLRQHFRPQLTADIDLTPYDVIAVGFPIWWGTMPTDLMVFLERHSADFAGKAILPFCTHEGSRFEHSLTDLKAMLPDAHILSGLELYGHVAQDARLLAREQAKLTRFLAQVQ